MRNFRTYDIWQDAKTLVKEVYQLLRFFPNEERYALCDQLRRAIISIPSNIAEGAGRETETEFAHFLDIALGSAYEVETQIEIASDLQYIGIEEKEVLVKRLQSLEKRISLFIESLRKKSKVGEAEKSIVAGKACEK